MEPPDEVRIVLAGSTVRGFRARVPNDGETFASRASYGISGSGFFAMCGILCGILDGKHSTLTGYAASASKTMMLLVSLLRASKTMMLLVSLPRTSLDHSRRALQMDR